MRLRRCISLLVILVCMLTFGPGCISSGSPDGEGTASQNAPSNTAPGSHGMEKDDTGTGTAKGENEAPTPKEAAKSTQKVSNSQGDYPHSPTKK